jgi:ammonium transporter, Amt family
VVSGAVYKKRNSMHFLVFIFIWATLVYDPIARWSWNTEGWSNRLGSLDFAGGTVVHIVSATTTAVYAKFVNLRAKLRREVLPDDLNREDTPSNVSHVVLGTVFLWIGWFGFNGGSALGANLRAVSACISTTMAACTGGLTLCVVDRLMMLFTDDLAAPLVETRFSVISFCNGVVAGLVAITPAAGFVCLSPYSVRGASNYSTNLIS